jgi:hypothetical protein
VKEIVAGDAGGDEGMLCVGAGPTADGGPDAPRVASEGNDTERDYHRNGGNESAHNASSGLNPAPKKNTREECEKYPAGVADGV